MKWHENEVQEIQLRLMELASFNCFDGKTVVRSLRDHHDLWEAAVMDNGEYNRLIKLRDLPDNYWNVDTLYIIPAKGKEEKLCCLAKDWNADEVSYLSQEESSELLGTYPSSDRLLRVWWD